jgi:hypothetical protein
LALLSVLWSDFRCVAFQAVVSGPGQLPWGYPRRSDRSLRLSGEAVSPPLLSADPTVPFAQQVLSRNGQGFRPMYRSGLFCSEERSPEVNGRVTEEWSWIIIS